MRFTITGLIAAAFASTALATKIYSNDAQIRMSDDYRVNYELPEDNMLQDECESWTHNCLEYMAKNFKDQIPVVECGHGSESAMMSLSCRGITVEQRTPELAKLVGYKLWNGEH
ncbi:hypothetical protein K492DRAFT_209593 [Lichtheimia hyalospora FSU 10163]|nr:hypothetical protein K492DRAFT_209593 [Lichtheimia hyalospora FSU 10163]